MRTLIIISLMFPILLSGQITIGQTYTIGSKGVSSVIGNNLSKAGISRKINNNNSVDPDTMYKIYRAQLVCADGENITETILVNTLGLTPNNWYPNFNGDMDSWNFFHENGNNSFTGATIIFDGSYVLEATNNQDDTVYLEAINNIIDKVITIKKLKDWYH